MQQNRNRLSFLVALLLSIVLSLAGQSMLVPYATVEAHPNLQVTALADDDDIKEKIKAELQYYLERHDVRDEGYDMVARYASALGADTALVRDSTLFAYMPPGPMKLRNVVRWNGLPREGKGMATDAQGRTIVGLFHADTLVSGVRFDSLGTYAGMFNKEMEASGHGSYRGNDGSYYEGHWEHDLQDGFGFCVSPSFLKAGWWKKGRFVGERMTHTSERIYGIDISRYQHEHGRRVYPINWKQLRIKHLGRRISSERVSGSVDYPVRFVYIKSTQGTDIINRFYLADYRSCRRENLRVGAYHFFSVKTRGIEQAAHFLANTRFQQGDLPPALDIEPSDKQIERMGGPEKMFGEIRDWLRTVEASIGIRPLLYVNPTFISLFGS